MTRIAPRIFAFAVGWASLIAQTEQPGCDCTPMIDIKSLGAVSARSLAHKPPNPARKQFDRGMQAWRKGRSNQALVHLAEAARLDPDYLEAQADLGVAYASTGQLSQALDRFEQALKLEPSFHVLYENKAGALMMLDRLEKAENVAREALRLAPESIDAHYTLGMALVMQGKITPEAESRLTKAAAKDPRARRALASLEDYLGSRRRTALTGRSPESPWCYSDARQSQPALNSP